MSEEFIIDINIDNEKFFKMGDDWNKISNAILIGIENGKNEFALRLRDKVLEYLTIYGLGESKLANNINVIKTADGIAVNCGNAEYAVFVEYGTGIVGEQNPHPHPKRTWIYRSGVNSSEHEGWYYPTDASDPNPNKHVFDGQLYAYTKGIPSRPFMYMSWLWGTRSIINIINKNIRKEIRNAIGGMQ